ncbi:hypothetical protein Cni_G24999 [Canna indica]|uniref:OTU domain-containing protein n=1 Tax=Canna indica TaxID=4628 RepID=A0AAQ3L3K2_9LILI|nr:hypothetical protein Cni_G24999 [Canna indica]
MSQSAKYGDGRSSEERLGRTPGNPRSDALQAPTHNFTSAKRLAELLEVGAAVWESGLVARGLEVSDEHDCGLGFRKTRRHSKYATCIAARLPLPSSGKHDSELRCVPHCRRDEVQASWLQEKKKLQDKEMSLKKAAAKGSKAEQKAKKEQVEDEISILHSQLEAKHAQQLASMGYKTTEKTEKEDLHILVKAIAGSNVRSHSESIKQSKGARRRVKKAQEEAAREHRIQEEQCNMISDRMIENEILEKKLEPLGLTIKEIKPDGHCLYRAVENQLSLHSNNTSPYNFQELRKMAANYMRNHGCDFLPFFLSEGTVEVDADREPMERFERYCEEVESTAVWGGQLELSALTHCLRKHIIIYSGSFPDVEMGKEYKCEIGTDVGNQSIMLSISSTCLWPWRALQFSGSYDNEVIICFLLCTIYSYNLSLMYKDPNGVLVELDEYFS